jgi:hypothetical protein
MMGAIALGTLLAAGAATAQTAGPSVGPALPDIVPVTGPSAVASLPEPAKPAPAPSGAPGVVQKGAKGKVGGPRPAVGRGVTGTRQAARGVKAVHSSGPKATARKAAAATRVTKGAVGPGKAARAAAATRHKPGHHAVVGKPIPLTKRQGPAKGVAPVQPVLPRV